MVNYGMLTINRFAATPTRAAALLALFVGSFLILTQISHASNGDNCVGCHQDQVSKWLKSDHAKAMAVATSNTVLGDFGDTRVSHFSQTARFYKKESAFFIDFTEQDKTSTYKVDYVFGHYPLQQYLIKTKSDRMQVFPFAWDSRSKEEGGQRWYPIYDTEDIQPNDRLHWQQPLQNWNGMCADCHSDGLKRNFDIDSLSFDTTYDNINVGCASCHTNTKQLHDGTTQASSNGSKSLSPHAADAITRSAGLWQRSANDKVATLIEPADTDAMETCFACHSLRSPLTDGIDPSSQYMDQFTPTLLAPPMYHADGQIKEEVYVYGSFLQSKMYNAGVTCMNCHDAHTMKPKIEGNGLCLQCHDANQYQKPEHLNHALDSTGAQCVSCHMPETTYMGVDDRRDHSFSIPRPHLSAAFDTPNACNKCHQEESNQWAANTVKQWYGRPPAASSAEQQYMQLMHQQYLPLSQLLSLARNNDLPPIKQASVLSMANLATDTLSDSQIAAFVTHPNALIRLSAAKLGQLLSPQERLKGYRQLLQDEVKAVRVAAAEHLLELTAYDQIDASSSAFAEYDLANQVSSWRGEGNLNRSLAASKRQDETQAIAALQDAIKVDPYFDASYINLAEAYRQVGNLSDEQKTLALGISTNNVSAALRYAEGMRLIRAGLRVDSIALFEKAVELAPNETQYFYLYALALDATGDTAIAIKALKRKARHYRYDARLMQLGMSFSQKAQDLNNYLFFKQFAR